MSYEVDIITPASKEIQGIFFASESDSLFRRIDLQPLKNDLEIILSLLNEISDEGKFEINEVSLTAGVASEESGKDRAGLSLKLLQFGGELGHSTERVYSENSLIQIKIKRK